MEVWAQVLIILGVIFCVSFVALVVANGCMKVISKPSRSEKRFIFCVGHAQLEIEQVRQLQLA